jgi:cell division protein ZapA (FtsZ GTPase activity inhibitor)
MSIKIAVGSKIYEFADFSDQESEGIKKLAKSLNYRVNQVISAFGIFDQEMALVMAALSILEENETMQANVKQEELFPENTLNTYTKAEVEEILVKTISSLTLKVKQLNQ